MEEVESNLCVELSIISWVHWVYVYPHSFSSDTGFDTRTDGVFDGMIVF